MPGRIEDYALIGDCQSAALVCNDGSIDWLCLPRFDSGACFAALLGDEENGRWQLAPSGAGRATRRRYRGDTLILETEWETSAGSVRVIDFMPHRGEAPDIVRIVEGLAGEVSMTMDLRLRFDYGHRVPWMHKADGQLAGIAGPDSIWLRTPVEVAGQDFAHTAEFSVSEGERIPFVLTWHPSHMPPPKPVEPLTALMETEELWNEWVGRISYTGTYRDAVVRSLITLKALTYAPTGGIVAAPTTSLPEALGGVRNWDYRFCWLRDATMTLDALLRSGCTDEAASWRKWLLRAVAGSPEDVQIMYGVAGERRLTEWEVDWLPGYEDSSPVRVGNAAAGQLQLDVPGEVMNSLYLARKAGLPREEHMWSMQQALVKYVEEHWADPDEGLWEIRGERRHFVHSKMMCWAAMDRAIRMSEEFGYPGPVSHWRGIRDEIHAQVCEKGYDPVRGTFTQSYGSTEVDAALLMMTTIGFLPPDDPRVIGTIEAVQRELAGDGFVRRYPTHEGEASDGLVGEEGAFLACSFWLAENLCLIGREEEGHALFERLLSLRNDVGLLAEEYDPRAGRLVGNFPQAFSHVPLVHTAYELDGHRLDLNGG
ncbi:glycoside hydrolase family 15 protein [Actinomadura barringtoniae]|uniref:Trehalase n=1 Tax=Actinomadura barringtoniae TaxID=1427535 RepID=A0A939PH18_9ACTN|nr:glycoside hydrolase family 15 protein [Actinomadura barringtoniae]MBO2449958.1 glycoside hydrolase family 15 protein [Actinomadura barringtoniae]